MRTASTFRSNDNGAKSWLLRYERHGRERWMGLGPSRLIKLSEARERARKARLLLLDGIDPIDAKRFERAAHALEAAKMITFEDAASQYYAAHERRWKNPKHRAQFLITLGPMSFQKSATLAWPRSMPAKCSAAWSR